MRADSGSGQARRGFPLRLCASARVPALVWPKPILAPASLKTQRRQDRKNPSPRLVEGFNDTVLDPERAIHRQVWASEWRQANAEPIDLGSVRRDRSIFLPTTGRRHTRSSEAAKAGGVAAAWFVFALLRVSHGLDGRAQANGVSKRATRWLGRSPLPHPISSA